MNFFQTKFSCRALRYLKICLLFENQRRKNFFFLFLDQEKIIEELDAIKHKPTKLEIGKRGIDWLLIEKVKGNRIPIQDAAHMAIIQQQPNFPKSMNITRKRENLRKPNKIQRIAASIPYLDQQIFLRLIPPPSFQQREKSNRTEKVVSENRQRERESFSISSFFGDKT